MAGRPAPSRSGGNTMSTTPSPFMSARSKFICQRPLSGSSLLTFSKRSDSTDGGGTGSVAKSTKWAFSVSDRRSNSSSASSRCCAMIHSLWTEDLGSSGGSCWTQAVSPPP